MSILDIDDITGWEEHHWKVTQAGNWKEFLAENTNEIVLWLNDSGGRGDNWGSELPCPTRSRLTPFAR